MADDDMEMSGHLMGYPVKLSRSGKVSPLAEGFIAIQTFVAMVTSAFRLYLLIVDITMGRVGERPRIPRDPSAYDHHITHLNSKTTY